MLFFGIGESVYSCNKMIIIRWTTKLYWYYNKL